MLRDGCKWKFWIVLDGAVVAASCLQFFGSVEIGCGMGVNAVWQVLKSAYSYCDLNIDKWVEPGEESVPRCTLSFSSHCL